MSTLQKGLVLAAVQILLVGAVGAKLLFDRARYPDVWVETVPFDPDTPLRGRYVQFQPLVEGEGFPNREYFFEPGRLEVRDGALVGIPDAAGSVDFTRRPCGSGFCLTLTEPLAFFIPEEVEDPSIRPEGEELWARLTIPPRGAPRPIELGVREGEGEIVPLDL